MPCVEKYHSVRYGFLENALGCKKGCEGGAEDGCAEDFIEIEQKSGLRGTTKTSVAEASAIAGMSLALAGKRGIKEQLAREAFEMFFRYLKSGSVSRPFCLGEKVDCDRKDELKSIAGEALLTSEAGANGRKSAKLAAKIRRITLGAVVYLGASSIDKDFAKKAISVMGDAGRM